MLPLLQLLLQLIALRDDAGDAGVQIQMRDRQRRACLIEHLITPRDIIQQLIAARIADTDAPRALLEADDLQHLQIAKLPLRKLAEPMGTLPFRVKRVERK